MFERIATIITAIGFMGTLVLGLIITIIDLISYSITGHQFTPVSPIVLLISLILSPPAYLILIYSGAGLDKIFKLKNK
jgi:hypothetical protein